LTEEIWLYDIESNNIILKLIQDGVVGYSWDGESLVFFKTKQCPLSNPVRYSVMEEE